MLPFVTLPLRPWLTALTVSVSPLVFSSLSKTFMLIGMSSLVVASSSLATGAISTRFRVIIPTSVVFPASMVKGPLSPLNITIPEEVAKKLAPIRNKSRFIAEAVKEKIQREKRRKLEKLMIEGYQNSAKEDKDINEVWQQVNSDEGWE